jgi:hypothetical protein
MKMEGNMKNSKLMAIVSAIFILSLFACSNLNLSNEDAKIIISSNFKNGGLIECEKEIEVKNASSIISLIQGGYLVAGVENVVDLRESVGMLVNTLPFGPSINGKQYVRGSNIYPKGAIRQTTMAGISSTSATFEGAVKKQAVKEIKEVSIDKTSKTAIVTYLMGYEPVEPFHSSVCTGNQSKDCDLSATNIIKVTLQKGDKGWQVIDKMYDKAIKKTKTDE